MNPLLFLAIAISFLATFFFTWKWIPVARRVGLVGKDANKYAQPEVAEMGGVAVMAGILGGTLFYVGLNTFVLNQPEFNLTLFATISTIMIIAFVGIVTTCSAGRWVYPSYRSHSSPSRRRSP